MHQLFCVGRKGAVVPVACLAALVGARNGRTARTLVGECEDGGGSVVSAGRCGFGGDTPVGECRDSGGAEVSIGEDRDVRSAVVSVGGHEGGTGLTRVMVSGLVKDVPMCLLVCV